VKLSTILLQNEQEIQLCFHALFAIVRLWTYGFRGVEALELHLSFYVLCDNVFLQDKKSSLAAPNQNAKPASKGVSKAKKKVNLSCFTAPHYIK
jgi:hypothetical protein